MVADSERWRKVALYAALRFPLELPSCHGPEGGSAMGTVINQYLPESSCILVSSRRTTGMICEELVHCAKGSKFKKSLWKPYLSQTRNEQVHRRKPSVELSYLLLLSSW